MMNTPISFLEFERYMNTIRDLFHNADETDTESEWNAVENACIHVENLFHDKEHRIWQFFIDMEPCYIYEFYLSLVQNYNGIEE